MKDKRTVKDLLIEWDIVEVDALSRYQKERPALKAGYTYGKNLKWSEVKPGDDFMFTGSRSLGRTGGKIKKINKKTVVYVSIYKPAPSSPGEEVTHTLRKDNLYGGKAYVSRGKTMHEIEPLTE